MARETELHGSSEVLPSLPPSSYQGETTSPLALANVALATAELDRLSFLAREEMKREKSSSAA